MYFMKRKIPSLTKSNQEKPAKIVIWKWPYLRGMQIDTKAFALKQKAFICVMGKEVPGVQ